MPTISTRLPAAIAALCAVLVACSSTDPARPLGPPTPSGVTPIPGGPLEQLPVPASPKIPASQREAQDTILRYLQQTIDALPKGTSLDGTRYIVGDGTTYCEDNPSSTDAPVHVEDWRDMTTPPEVVDFNALINQVGELWKSWGWDVLERDGFEKPNRFGYAPDGYALRITASHPPTYSPGIIGASPCFPGNLKRDDVPRNPPVIVQQGS